MKTKLFKLLSLVTAVCFLFNSTAVMAEMSFTKADLPAAPSLFARPDASSLENLRIPEQYGRIEKQSQTTKDPSALQLFSSSAPTVVLVKDAHCNYEAQKNIMGILETLVRDYKTGLVCVEGAAGDLARLPELQNATKNDKVKDKVTDKFIKNGYLTASEALAIRKGDKLPFTIRGVEDKELYLKNVCSFRSVYRGHTEALETIAALKEVTNALKPKIYNEELLKFDVKAQEYKTDKIGLIDWIKILGKNEAHGKNVNLLMRAVALEEMVNYEKVETERARLLKYLEQRLTKEDLQELVQKSLYFRLGKITSAEYYKFLEQYLPIVSAKNMTEVKSLQDLRAYIHLIKLHSVIDEDSLFTELKTAENDVYASLCQTETEKELRVLDENLYVSEKLLNIEITRDELNWFKTNKENCDITKAITFLETQAAIFSIQFPVISKDIGSDFCQTAEKFYNEALERDNTLTANLLKEMRDKNQSGAVLVTGGFHSDGIKRILEKENINYIVIIPKITKEQKDCPYLSLMLDKNMDVESQLNSMTKATVAVPLTTAAQAPGTEDRVAEVQADLSRKTTSEKASSTKTISESELRTSRGVVDVTNADGTTPFTLAWINERQNGARFSEGDKPQPNVLFVDLDNFPSAMFESIMVQNLFFEAFCNMARADARKTPTSRLFASFIPLESRKTHLVVKSKGEKRRVLEMLRNFMVARDATFYAQYKQKFIDAGYAEDIAEALFKEFAANRSFAFPGALFGGLTEEQILEKIDETIMPVSVLDEDSPVTITEGVDSITISLTDNDYQVTHGDSIFSISRRDVDSIRKGDESCLVQPWTTEQVDAVKSASRLSELDGGNMQITALGNADPSPWSGKQDYTNLSIDYNGRTILIDASVQTIVNRKKNGLMDNVDAYYLTHCHGDHFGGIAYLVYDIINKQAKGESWDRINLMAAMPVYVYMLTSLSSMTGKTEEGIAALFNHAPSNVEGDKETVNCGTINSKLDGLKLTLHRTFGHPLPCYGFKAEAKGIKMAYLPDSKLPTATPVSEELNKDHPRYIDMVQFFGDCDLLISENGAKGVHITNTQLLDAFKDHVADGTIYTVHTAGPQMTYGLRRLQTFTPIRVIERAKEKEYTKKLKTDLELIGSIMGIEAPSSELLEGLAKYGKVIEHEKDTTLYEEGEEVSQNPFAYVVIGGTVDIDGIGKRGRGSIVGEMGILRKCVDEQKSAGDINTIGGFRSLEELIRTQVINGTTYYVWAYEVTEKTIEDKFSGDANKAKREAALRIFKSSKRPPRNKTIIADSGAVLLRIDADEVVKLSANVRAAEVAPEKATSPTESEMVISALQRLMRKREEENKRIEWLLSAITYNEELFTATASIAEGGLPGESVFATSNKQRPLDLTVGTSL